MTVAGGVNLSGVAADGIASGISASALAGSSGDAGKVAVLAQTLTVEGGAQIASSTAGPGKGSDVEVIVTSDIVLRDLGPQITARSTDTGDAGAVKVSAFRLLMSNGAAIGVQLPEGTCIGHGTASRDDKGRVAVRVTLDSAASHMAARFSSRDSPLTSSERPCRRQPRYAIWECISSRISISPTSRKRKSCSRGNRE